MSPDRIPIQPAPITIKADVQLLRVLSPVRSYTIRRYIQEMDRVIPHAEPTNPNPLSRLHAQDTIYNNDFRATNTLYNAALSSNRVTQERWGRVFVHVVESMTGSVENRRNILAHNLRSDPQAIPVTEAQSERQRRASSLLQQLVDKDPYILNDVGDMQPLTTEESNAQDVVMYEILRSTFF